MIPLGSRVQDRVTGFEGIAVARIVYLNGCVQICIKPPVMEGKMLAGEYVDDAQVVIIGPGVTIDADPDGGLMADTPTDSYGG